MEDTLNRSCKCTSPGRLYENKQQLTATYSFPARYNREMNLYILRHHCSHRLYENKQQIRLKWQKRPLSGYTFPFEKIPEVVNLLHLRVQKLYAAAAIMFVSLRLVRFITHYTLVVFLIINNQGAILISLDPH